MTKPIFSSPTGLVSHVTLTDVNGVELERVTDAPGFFKLSATDIATSDFYIDFDGSLYMNVLSIAVTASIDVALEAKYIWIVGTVERTKTLYSDQLETSDAEYDCPTAYPAGELVPHGTKHLVRVNSGLADSGSYEVYVSVMAEQGTVVVTDESEDIPDNLDVTFGGVDIHAISEPSETYEVPQKETTLASGQTYIQNSTVQKFNKTYVCGPLTYSEKNTILALLGTKADLVIDGTTYTGCTIKPPLTFTEINPCTGIYTTTLTFRRHTSPL